MPGDEFLADLFKPQSVSSQSQSVDPFKPQFACSQPVSLQPDSSHSQSVDIVPYSRLAE